jgi:hypothetical protein
MRRDRELTKLPYDAENLIEMFKSKYPDDFDAFVRMTTPNYMECGVEYYYRGKRYLLVDCDISYQNILYNFKQLDYSSDGHGGRIQFASTDKELFEIIKRVDETVEFNENIIDSGRFKNFVGEGYNATVEIRKIRHIKLSLSVFIWNNLTGDSVSCSFRIDEGWSINIHKKHHSTTYIGRYLTRVQAMYLVKEWILNGELSIYNAIQQGDRCVFMGKHRRDLTYGKVYTCSRSLVGDIQITNDVGNDIYFNRYHFMPMSAYRKIKMKQLDFV